MRRAHAWARLALLSTATAAGCADTPRAVLVPGEPAVAYLVTPRTGAAQEVHVQDIRSGGHRSVSGSGVEGSVLRALEVSDDGHYLAYVADHAMLGQFHLYVADLRRATAPKRVPLPSAAPASGVGRVALSPDGTQAAVLAEVDKEELYELFLVDLSSRDVTRVTSAARPEVSRRAQSRGVVRWSPDGGRVAFTADHHTPNVFDLYVVDAEGRDLQRLTDLTVYDRDGDGVPDNGIEVERDFAWAADGRWLYFHLAAQRPDFGRVGGREVWATSPDGETSLRLYPEADGPIGDADGDGVLDGRVWACPVSPTADSRYAFSVHTEEGSALYLADAGDAGVALLSDDAAVGQLAWRPNGDALAFVRRHEPQLWYASVEQGTLRPLGGLPSEDATGPRSHCGGDTIRWAPAGDEVAYVASEEGPWDGLYAVGHDGSGLRRVSAAGVAVIRPAYDPRGDFLLYTAEDDSHGARLVAVSTEDGVTRMLGDALPAGATLSHHFLPFVPAAQED